MFKHILLLLTLLPLVASAETRLVPLTASTDGNDLVGTEADINFLKNSPWPGNLDTSHLPQIFVSTTATGFLPRGYDLICDAASDEGPIGCDADADCTGSCDRVNYFADKRLPLKSLSGAYSMFERVGRGHIWLDAGEVCSGDCIGDSTLSQTGMAIGNDAELNCNDNTLPCFVFSGYPAGEIANINYATQSDSGTSQTPATLGLANPDIDFVIVAENVSDSQTVITDTSITMVADELIGDRAMVTNVDDAGCDLTLYDMEEITDNAATTVTIDDIGGSVDDCVFTVVSTSQSAVNSINEEHIDIQGADDGLSILLNLNLHNIYETVAIHVNDKNPSVPIALWNVWVRSSIVDGETGPTFHFNSPETAYLFNSGVVDAAARTAFDTSGNVLGIGAHFHTTGVNARAVAITRGFATTFIDSYFVADTDSNDNDATLLNTTCNVDVAGECKITLIRSVFAGANNTTDPALDIDFADANTTISSFAFKCLYSSFVKSETSIRWNADQADGFSKSIYMRACAFDDYTDIFIKGSGTDVYGGIDFDIQDTVFDDSAAGDWNMETNGINTAALARDDLIANSVGVTGCGVDDADATDPLTTCFFGGTSVDFEGTAMSGGDTDLTKMGSCHEGRDECFQITTYRISETVDSSLCLLGWELPSGEKVCRWDLNQKGSLSRGAP